MTEEINSLFYDQCYFTTGFFPCRNGKNFKAEMEKLEKVYSDDAEIIKI